jgi:hypothetical protein
MYRIFSFPFYCLLSALLIAIGQAGIEKNSCNAIAIETAQEKSGSKIPTPSPTPRKRRPYDPELQPPEKTTTAVSAADARISTCFPPGIDLDARVADTTLSPKQNLTVSMRLKQLKARCQKGKLVDRKGRQIRFYNLIGCWGNPPADYEEMLQNQTREIEQLEKRYTVIQIPCAQSDPSSIN